MQCQLIFVVNNHSSSCSVVLFIKIFLAQQQQRQQKNILFNACIVCEYRICYTPLVEVMQMDVIDSHAIVSKRVI